VNSKEFTPEEHQEEHKQLHRELDILLACYLSQRREPRTSIYDPIFEVMKWSFAMTQFPLPPNGIMPPEAFLTATNDDPELLEWMAKAEKDGGGFVKAIATAGLRADHENYPLLRPVLLAMRKKYSAYEPSEAVKQEIRERKDSVR
jgi:hypothetical protein